MIVAHRAPMPKRIARLVAAAGCLSTFIACEDCPERAVALSAEPTTVSHQTPTRVRLTFASDVFSEPSPARERDIRIMLMTAENRPVVEWRGSAPAPSALQDVRVIDARSLTVTIRLDTSETASRYELRVVADSAGACEGPTGAVTLDAP